MLRSRSVDKATRSSQLGPYQELSVVVAQSLQRRHLFPLTRSRCLPDDQLRPPLPVVDDFALVARSHSHPLTGCPAPLTSHVDEGNSAQALHVPVENSLGN